MLADGLTKLSSPAQVDAVRKVMEDSLIRITYRTVSGRKEKQKLVRLDPPAPAAQGLESAINV